MTFKPPKQVYQYRVLFVLNPMSFTVKIYEIIFLNLNRKCISAEAKEKRHVRLVGKFKTRKKIQNLSFEVFQPFKCQIPPGHFRIII